MERMTVWELVEALGLPEAAGKALAAVQYPDMKKWTRELLEDPERVRAVAGRDGGLFALGLCLEGALAAKDRYEDLGLPEQVFRDGIRDIALWTWDHWDKHGRPGLAEWEWVSNTLRLKVFRLGRLQFEPRVLEREIPGYPAGTAVLEVHIPAGEPLEPEEVKKSLEEAPGFFRTYFQKEFSLFHCHSWLLSPGLKELLPDRSRILQFQNLFTVYGEDDERQAEERVFGYVTDDVSDYPENTSLQRTLKQALLEGKNLGMGMGIRPIS